MSDPTTMTEIVMRMNEEEREKLRTLLLSGDFMGKIVKLNVGSSREHYGTFNCEIKSFEAKKPYDA